MTDNKTECYLITPMRFCLFIYFLLNTDLSYVQMDGRMDGWLDGVDFVAPAKGNNPGSVVRLVV